jgi:hypothetical protein
MSGGQQNQANPARTVLSTRAFTSLGDLLLVCTRGAEPPAADFEVWMDRLRKPDFDKMLIYSEGGTPSPMQRARIAEFWKSSGRTPPKAVMLTNSLVERGVLTAIGWLLGGDGIKCLPLAAVEPALIWLGYTGSVAEVSSTIRSLQASLEARQVG